MKTQWKKGDNVELHCYDEDTDKLYWINDGSVIHRVMNDNYYQVKAKDGDIQTVASIYLRSPKKAKVKAK